MDFANKNLKNDSEIEFFVDDIFSQVATAQEERSNGYQGRKARNVLADLDRILEENSIGDFLLGKNNSILLRHTVII